MPSVTGCGKTRSAARRILMHAESVDLSPPQLETLLHSRAPLEEVFETYRNTDSDFLMLEMHDAMETCADDAMAVQRSAAVYAQPPDYAREHGELDKLRTDYAMNPDKTENGKLISAFACDPHTADAEFLLSKRQYRQFTGREQTSDVIAYQVRQSFKPGEITPEEANRIGVEFAERFLKGKHAYIVCTHTDRQHIHNHILWNSTTLDCRGKFNNFWGSSRAVRALSDTLCIEHGLSVVEAPKRRGKSYNKWLAEQRPSLLIDIQAKLSEGKGAGYERWAKVFNLKQMAQTINFLKENGDMDFDELSRRAEAASEECSALTEKLKATEARMSEVEALKKQVINYLRTREAFRAYKASGYSKRYLAEHEQEILLHRAAKKAFNDLGLKKLPTVKALQAEHAALLAEKSAAYPAYREARAEMKKLLTYRANAEAILGGKECIANTPSKYGHR